ncbi:MAG: hypothetical protein HYY11_09325 [Candidatus Methylomirabilis oxyfera]|nr:hypothetical protein [Candidatus Methylomirabilis oxyfera]
MFRKPGSKGLPRERPDITEEDASRHGTYAFKFLETLGQVFPAARLPEQVGKRTVAGYERLGDIKEYGGGREIEADIVDAV